VLLQVLDDGRLTDSQGRTVDFKNTIIILTSNIGSHYYGDPLNGKDFDLIQKEVLEEVRATFRPEFINRLDEMIVFKSLTAAEIRKIVNIQLDQVAKRLSDRGITLEITDEAATHLAGVGFDPTYGARPLKRAVQKEILNPLAQALLRGEIHDNTTVKIAMRDGSIVFEKQEEAKLS
jgi:ATP-dependent Clp protease ATP-binding subunit ClpB